MKSNLIRHKFVEFIPPELVEDTLYISTTYATAVHLCASGCGNKVVTPLSPAEWQLKFDGDTVSLTPSIGNWEFPCRSHYWISHDQIRWASTWTTEQVAAGRRRDRRDQSRYFAQRKNLLNEGRPNNMVANTKKQHDKSTLIKLKDWLRRTSTR